MLKPKGCETMDNEKSTMGLTTERKPGGLYRNVRISVKTADRLILVGIVVLIACVVFAISHAGFTVTFDTNGGSQIENQKVMHGQLVNVENDPVKEGYVFTGWYSDRDCTKAFDISKDTVNESITLYSGWDKAEGHGYIGESICMLQTKKDTTRCNITALEKAV